MSKSKIQTTDAEFNEAWSLIHKARESTEEVKISKVLLTKLLQDHSEMHNDYISRFTE